MKSLYKIVTRRNVTLLFLIYITCLTSLIYIYYSHINIYGNLNIEVYENEINITDKCVCEGIRISRYKVPINISDSVFTLHESLYLNKLRITLPKNTNNYEIKITDINNNILEYNSFNDGNILTISAISCNYSKFEMFTIPYFNRLFFFVLIITSINILLIIILFNKEKPKTIIITNILLSPLFIYTYHLLVIQKILIYSGVFLIAFIFTGMVYLIWIIKKDKIKRIKTITIISSIFVTIIFCEILLRVFGLGQTRYEYNFRYYKSMYDQNKIVQDFSRPFHDELVLKTPEFRYIRKVNSLGLSDKEPILTKKENDFLIVGLGDSFTEGDGAHSDSTWLKFLERKMSINLDFNYRYINAGICGSDPFYEYKLLKDKLLIYKPDLVVVAYGYDLNDIILRGGIERFETGELAIKEPFFEPIYANSYVFRLLVHKLLKYDEYLISPKKKKTHTLRAILQLKYSITLFDELSEKYAFDLIIVFYPQKKEIINEKYDFASELIEFSNNNNINNLDLLEYYNNIEGLDSKNVSNYYWKNDGHHNAKGYELFANGVKWKIESLYKYQPRDSINAN